MKSWNYMSVDLLQYNYLSYFNGDREGINNTNKNENVIYADNNTPITKHKDPISLQGALQEVNLPQRS